MGIEELAFSGSLIGVVGDGLEVIFLLKVEAWLGAWRCGCPGYECFEMKSINYHVWLF